MSLRHSLQRVSRQSQERSQFVLVLLEGPQIRECELQRQSQELTMPQLHGDWRMPLQQQVPIRPWTGLTALQHREADALQDQTVQRFRQEQCLHVRRALQFPARRLSRQ